MNKTEQKYSYLIKLLEEYLDSNNNIDNNTFTKVTRSTNRIGEAQMFLDNIKNGKLTDLEDNKPKSNNSKVRVYMSFDKQSDAWYRNHNGTVYNVKECYNQGDLSDMHSFSGKDPKDVYIVIDGEFKGNGILKEDCKIINK